MTIHNYILGLKDETKFKIRYFFIGVCQHCGMPVIEYEPAYSTVVMTAGAYKRQFKGLSCYSLLTRYSYTDSDRVKIVNEDIKGEGTVKLITITVLPPNRIDYCPDCKLLKQASDFEIFIKQVAALPPEVSDSTRQRLIGEYLHRKE